MPAVFPATSRVPRAVALVVALAITLLLFSAQPPRASAGSPVTAMSTTSSRSP